MQGKPCTTLHARRKSSLRHCWDCPSYSPFSRGARRAGADQGGFEVLWLSLSVGGAQARSHPVCSQPTQATRDWVPRTRERRQASQPKQRGTGSRVRESGGRPGGRIGSRPTGTGISRRLPDRRRTWGENVRTFVQTHWATCAGVRAGVRAGNCAGACTGRTRALGRPNAGMALRYWAWPATFHIGRRGAAAFAHLLQRPVWPMQQPPSSAWRRRCSARAWA